MNVQEAEEFKTSKFFCKTDFDMKEIKKGEAAYVPLLKFHTFKSREETGTHSLSEFRECGNGGKRNDKGRAEQTGN